MHSILTLRILYEVISQTIRSWKSVASAQAKQCIFFFADRNIILLNYKLLYYGEHYVNLFII